jgi:hypothetical protein
MLQIAQFNFKVFRRSSFTGGISVVPNVSDKRGLGLTAKAFFMPGQGSLWRSSLETCQIDPDSTPIRKASTVGRRCGKGINGRQEVVMKLLLEIGRVHPDSERTMKADTEQLISKRQPDKYFGAGAERGLCF